jgi:DNA excision repair protein ERCC-4
MALQKKITFKKINDSFSNCKKDDGNVAPKKPKLNEEGAEKKPEDEKTEECEDIRSSYLLTMSQSSGGSKEDYVFEPHEEVGTIDSCVSALFKLLHFQLENMNLTQICQSLTAPTILIQTFKGTKDVVNLQRSLEELQPSFIVMYHSNLTAIREIEMYEAHRKRDTPMKVYFLIHAGTVEEQSYLTSMRREKEAFEFLIQTKSVHSLPISLPNTREHFLVDHGRPRRPRRQI